MEELPVDIRRRVEVSHHVERVAVVAEVLVLPSVESKTHAAHSLPYLSREIFIRNGRVYGFSRCEVVVAILPVPTGHG